MFFLSPRIGFPRFYPKEVVEAEIVDYFEGGTGTQMNDGYVTQYVTFQDSDGCRGIYAHLASPFGPSRLSLRIGETIKIIRRRHRMFRLEMKVVGLAEA